MTDTCEAQLICYDCKTGCFSAPAGTPLPLDSQEAAPLRERMRQIADEAQVQAKFMRLSMGGKCYQVSICCTAPGVAVTAALMEAPTVVPPCQCTDPLTGLMNRDAFCSAVEQALNADPEGSANGDYAIVYIDFHRFKVINDLFGRETGDQLLIHIANTLQHCQGDSGYSCRLVSDHFGVFLPTAGDAVEELLKQLSDTMHSFDLPFEITFHAGIYKTTGGKLSINAMLDRAALALDSIKGNYNIRYRYYTTEMRTALLSEQEITGLMGTALAEKQFVIHYQPQYNHSTGMLVGAEALVRWFHPEKGLLPPDVFIPIFEKNGFIVNLDLYVFEQVCIFLRKCIDSKFSLVPISVNFTRYDIYQPNFAEQLEQLRSKYDVPAKYLRVELTESVMIDGADYVNSVLKALHTCGYIVEMDDFGSGYSSLNTLKDIDLDIIKLDMRFLSNSSHNPKGGTILSSVVRMAKWLQLPVIAEGVETVDQADFLRSIGCEYVQGYLYSKPLPEDDYISLVSASGIGATVPQMKMIDTLNVGNFWDPQSQETLIFSNYVGAAAIFDFHNGKPEILRLNNKYLQELGMNLSERELIESDPLASMDAENQDIYLNMLYRAIETMEEQECETWQSISSSCCGQERFCIRTNVRVIGVSADRYLFHAMIRNITAERLYYESMQTNEQRMKMVVEQVKIYYWEYNIATKEMRPCFRCMRDLGLPPVVTNYPESAIEANIFPPEVADMYRDFMRQIDEGAPSMEAIIPLTLDRVPFHVRYTTEFDENGHPVKAYGSAALVVD